jgi:hypothetical protein
MRDRLRSFDSKITFFAFADIITAVSGMLIFITLLLATDLGRPTDNRSQAANAELERQLRETLTQQAAADAENRGLQNILTTVNTAPAPDKLESDISRLRAELAQEKSQHAGMAEQLAASKSTLEERDKVLGITAVRAHIQDSADELVVLARQDAKVREEANALEDQIAGVQTKIAKLRSRIGQLWLIPDRSTTSKEPLLVVVSGSSARIERFNHPEQTQEFGKSRAVSGFESFLKGAKPANQYVVFLIRPSGIALFKDLEKAARGQGFEVGFDALEEDKEIHFTSPPPIDDEAVPARRPQGSTGPRNSAGDSSPGHSGTDSSDEPGAKNGGASPTNAAAALTNTPPSSVTNTTPTATNTIPSATNAPPPATPPAPPKPKSWWQRFLEWIGIS